MQCLVEANCDRSEIEQLWQDSDTTITTRTDNRDLFPDSSHATNMFTLAVDQRLSTARVEEADEVLDAIELIAREDRHNDRVLLFLQGRESSEDFDLFGGEENGALGVEDYFGFVLIGDAPLIGYGDS